MLNKILNSYQSFSSDVILQCLGSTGKSLGTRLCLTLVRARNVESICDIIK